MAVYNNTPYIWANRFGIPRLESANVVISSTAVTFNFNPHRFLESPYSGLVLFKLDSFTAPATAVPVVFNTAGSTQALTLFGGEAVTSAELAGGGIILCYYENGTLQLLSTLTA